MTANSEQAEHWAGPSGLKWITYQEQMDAVLGSAAVHLFEVSGVGPGERVLDIGCGTGATSLALAGITGETGEVLGLDISAPLLEMARSRAGDPAPAQLAFRLGDAQTEPLPQAHFDLALSRFGVMFFDDPPAAFANIRRALRPGGRLAFIAWAGLPANPWFDLPRAVATERLGALPPPPPGAPGPMAFQDMDHVTGILTRAGFVDIRGAETPLTLHHPGGVDAAAELATDLGMAARIIEEKGGDETDRHAIRDGLRTALAPFETADGIRVPALFNVFTARAP